MPGAAFVSGQLHDLPLTRRSFAAVDLGWGVSKPDKPIHVIEGSLPSSPRVKATIAKMQCGWLRPHKTRGVGVY